MKPLLIGSVALKRRLILDGYEDLASSVIPKDLDIIARDAEQAVNLSKSLGGGFNAKNRNLKFKCSTLVLKHDGYGHIEITYPHHECTTLDLFNMDHEDCGNYRIPSLGVLLTMKQSHKYLKDSPHFIKTMHHIKTLQKLGVEIPSGMKEWLIAREKETYDYEHYTLNVNKDQFFINNFEYIYDHDSIHRAVKYLDKPAYEYYMTDNADVLCSKEKFFNESPVIRFMGVMEECYVLALERCLIPNNFDCSPKHAFLTALEKVCTSITSGWFREFAWNNYETFIQLYNENYVQKFKDALQCNQIIPYKGV